MNKKSPRLNLRFCLLILIQTHLSSVESSSRTILSTFTSNYNAVHDIYNENAQSTSDDYNEEDVRLFLCNFYLNGQDTECRWLFYYIHITSNDFYMYVTFEGKFQRAILQVHHCKKQTGFFNLVLLYTFIRKWQNFTCEYKSKAYSVSRGYEHLKAYEQQLMCVFTENN